MAGFEKEEIVFSQVLGYRVFGRPVSFFENTNQTTFA